MEFISDINGTYAINFSWKNPPTHKTNNIFIIFAGYFKIHLQYLTGRLQNKSYTYSYCLQLPTSNWSTFLHKFFGNKKNERTHATKVSFLNTCQLVYRQVTQCFMRHRNHSPHTIIGNWTFHQQFKIFCRGSFRRCRFPQPRKENVDKLEALRVKI